MSFGDGVDPVEDELIDRQKVAHNQRIRIGELGADLSSLRARLAEAIDEQHRLAGLVVACDGEHLELVECRAKLSSAAKALDKYGQHFPECSGVASPSLCTCGFTAALKEAKHV